MWRELAAELGLETFAPASPEDVAAAEAAVGCALPRPLRDLLEETDGIDDRVVFTARDIAQVNRDMRTNADFPELYMPFDALLFFGAEANSDLFGYRILAGAADDYPVFVWEHESDSRIATAHGLELYLRGQRWHEG
jgi:hypothetical protein